MTIRERSGHPDILFANAGLGRLVPLDKSLRLTSTKPFDVNVKETVLRSVDRSYITGADFFVDRGAQS